jgi:hypothetical protein
MAGGNGEPAKSNGESEPVTVTALLQSEKYAHLSDLHRTDRALYEEAKANVLEGRGPRTVEDCKAMIEYIERVMR